MPDIICFIGTDGSGKTTRVKKLVNDLNQKGIPAKYVWFRFPYFLTLILLGTARVLGFTKYLRHGKSRIVEHNFHRQPFKTLFPLLVFLDTLFYYTRKVAIPSKFDLVVVCDRWIYDIIVDITVDTRDPYFEGSLLGRLFNSLASRATFPVFLDAPDHVLEARRPETKLDPWASKRRLLYRSVANKHRLYTLYSNAKIDVTHQELMELLSKESTLRSPRSEKIYGNIKNYWLQPLLRRRFFVIAANWVFQNTLIMAKSELVFRFILESAFVVLIFSSLSSIVSCAENAVLSILIAHTVNWIINGNLWVTQKFFGRRFDPERMIKFLFTFRDKERLSQEGIAAIAAFGSLSRGEFSESSDLDIRIVRRLGLYNWIKANLVTLKLRLMAFAKRIPIDSCVLDSVNQIYEHISPNEPPVVIYDPDNSLSTINKNVIPLKNIRPETYKIKD